MSSQAQRIAIAEACGWKAGPHGYGSHCPWGVPPKSKQVSRPWEELPGFLSDLNAMHEAVKILSIGSVEEPAQYERYCKWVRVIEGGEGIDATATQRAEAFLRTLSLWDDTK